MGFFDFIWWLLVLSGLLFAIMIWLIFRPVTEESKSDIIDAIESAKVALASKYAVVSADGVMLGLRPEEQLLMLKSSDSGVRAFQYGALRAVSLTPTIRGFSTSAGQSRTRRGSQIFGAGLGAAVAGPAGAIIGGLSAPQEHDSTTSSFDYVASVELELFLRNDDLPRLSLQCSHPVMQSAFKDMAARLANIVEPTAK